VLSETIRQGQHRRVSRTGNRQRSVAASSATLCRICVRFSRRELLMVTSSGISRRGDRVSAHVSEARINSIFRVGNQPTQPALSGRWFLDRLIVDIEDGDDTFQTSVPVRTTRRSVPEHGNSHQRNNYGVIHVLRKLCTKVRRYLLQYVLRQVLNTRKLSR
jgi:hypothetical protein